MDPLLKKVDEFLDPFQGGMKVHLRNDSIIWVFP